MKNALLRVVSVVIVVLVAFSGLAVVPVAAKASRSITLINVAFIQRKGYVFKFNVSGDFQAKEFQGAAVYLSGNRYNLDCHPTDRGGLNCVAGDGLPKFPGRTVQGAVAGFTFSAVLPVPVRIYCLPIFDYDPSSVWGKIGSHCAGSPDDLEDSIKYYNPAWGSSFTYYHYNDGNEVQCDTPPAPSWGQGYYYDAPDYC